MRASTTKPKPMFGFVLRFMECPLRIVEIMSAA
jgi:hypothetical protein